MYPVHVSSSTSSSLAALSIAVAAPVNVILLPARQRAAVEYKAEETGKVSGCGRPC